MGFKLDDNTNVISGEGKKFLSVFKRSGLVNHLYQVNMYIGFMKTTSIFIVIYLCVFRLSAQSEFQVTGGLSIPSNDYADIDNKNTKSGFAGQGYLARFALYMYNENTLNPFIQVGSNYNTLRTDEKDNYLDSNFTIASVSRYRQLYLGLGLRINPGKSNRVSPYFEASMGASYNSTPEYYTFNPYKNESTPTRTIYSSDVYLGFAYGLYINLSKNTRFTLGSGFWFSPGSYNNDLTLPIQMQQFFTGMCFNLTKPENR